MASASRANVGQPGGKAFTGNSAWGNSRQHIGDVINNQTYQYTFQQQRPDDSLRDAQRGVAILKAAGNGETARLRELIARSENRDCKDFVDEAGRNALHHACLGGFEDTVQLLLELNIEVNAVSPSYGTGLCLAAIKGRAKVVDMLIRHRANVNAPGGHLGSALHAACLTDDSSIVRKLLEAGALVDAVRVMQMDFHRSLYFLEYPQTSNRLVFFETPPLHTAAVRGRCESVKILLSYGALVPSTSRGWSCDPNSASKSKSTGPGHKTWSGITALMRAATSGDVNTLNAILKASSSSRSPLPMPNPKVWVAPQKQTPVLPSGIAFVNARSSGGATALGCAALGSHTACVETLLDQRADPDIQNSNGKTAIHCAAERQDAGSLQALVMCGANQQLVDSSGRTALSCAARVGSVGCVRVLLGGQSASLSARLSSVGTTVRLTTEGDTSDRSDKHLLFDAINGGSSDVLQTLVAHYPTSCDVNRKFQAGSTPLAYAAQFANYDIVQCLIQLGAHPSIRHSNGSLPEEVAKKYGRADIERLLGDARRRWNMRSRYYGALV